VEEVDGNVLNGEREMKLCERKVYRSNGGGGGGGRFAELKVK